MLALSSASQMAFFLVGEGRESHLVVFRSYSWLCAQSLLQSLCLGFSSGGAQGVLSSANLIDLTQELNLGQLSVRCKEPYRLSGPSQ